MRVCLFAASRCSCNVHMRVFSRLSISRERFSPSSSCWMLCLYIYYFLLIFLFSFFCVLISSVRARECNNKHSLLCSGWCCRSGFPLVLYHTLTFYTPLLTIAPYCACSIITHNPLPPKYTYILCLSIS